MRREPFPDGCAGTVYLEFYEAAGKKTDRRKEHEISRRLLKKGLLEIYGLSCEAEPELLREGHGKPCLALWPEIPFNISHCEGLAACAFGRRELGLDVERIRPFSARSVERILSEREQETFCRSEHPREMFFRYWTLKESYGKAIGVGLGFPFREAEMFPEEKETAAFRTLNCSFYQTCFSGGYFLAVCMKNPPEDEPEERQEWNLEIYGY